MIQLFDNYILRITKSFQYNKSFYMKLEKKLLQKLDFTITLK